MLQKSLLKVIKELEKSNLSYVIIGGQASLIHGVVRLTQDIDITLGFDIDEMDKLQQLIKRLDFIYLKKDPEDFAKLTRVMPVYDTLNKVKIDFIFSFSDFERKAIKNSVIKKIKNTKVRFCSVEDLIIFKIIAGRELDYFDVKNILLKNPKADKKYINKWLSKFEKMNLTKYNEILETIISSVK